MTQNSGMVPTYAYVLSADLVSDTHESVIVTDYIPLSAVYRACARVTACLRGTPLLFS